jgi:hypothetical protein
MKEMLSYVESDRRDRAEERAEVFNVPNANLTHQTRERQVYYPYY